MSDELAAIILGSGLAPLAEAVEVRRRISFAEAGLPSSGVPGHAGMLVEGLLGGVPVWLMMGRVHLYEGHAPEAVAAGVRWLAGQGVRRLILTNAAGSLHPDYAPGSWMMLADHLNLTGVTPLRGAEFVDMTTAYDSAWRDRFRMAAVARGMVLHEGVYAGLRGPQYETPAEVRMLRTLGADAVGMSTVLETIQARALGLTVAGFSCLTNWAAGLGSSALDHQDVLATGKQAAAAMTGLLTAVIGERVEE